MMNLRSYHRHGIMIVILVMIVMLSSCGSERSGYEGKGLWVFGDSITKGVEPRIRIIFLSCWEKNWVVM